MLSPCEVGRRVVRMWTTDEIGEYEETAVCPYCITGEGDENGECNGPNCAPAVELGYSPVRASFVIVDGRVSEVALG